MTRKEYFITSALAVFCACLVHPVAAVVTVLGCLFAAPKEDQA